MRALLSVFLGLSLLPGPATACSIALLLMMDVSQSVDAGEYRLQTEGLARSLEDPEIRETLVRGQGALAVMQWSGQGAQNLSLPWRQIRGTGDLDVMAAQVRAMPRAFLMSNTALGDSIFAGLRVMEQAPDCAQKTIDVSGDGPENAGTNPLDARHAAQRAGVVINGLAIESLGLSITTYFRSTVVTRGGFVITARGYRDYARAIREKIARETAQVLF